ncbi:hypothetical protein [Microbacterium sp. Ag1]|uniref:hypothetical protein n=1 Tax=Microbacterium sp. Ag1 TaxID=1643443 RepID=UPI0012E05A68|nr:hypothetical protein [Microbacterium sp. Ag1]
MSTLKTTQKDRDEFLRGAELLRFYGEAAMPGRSPQAQQLVVADTLACGHQRNVILLPRRSSKSTSVIAVGLGRAEAREDYRVGILTLTSGKAGRSRFLKDVAPAIERLYPDKTTRPLKIVRSAGQERVEFPSGGSVSWLSSMDDLRGEAFDLVILDEAGEPDPEKVLEVLAAALPTLDTRPGAQIIAAGTAGRYRAGNLLWTWLALARSGSSGVLDYSVDDQDVTDAQLAAWEPTAEHPEGNVKNLVLASHPGVGTLTTLESIKNNYETLPIEKFAPEYLGIFGDSGNAGLLIKPKTWTNAGSSAPLPSPEHYALGLVCHPDQQSAALVAAWRDENGIAHILVDRHDRGTDWVAPYLKKHAKDRVPIAYDSFSAVTQVEVNKAEKSAPRPRTEPQRTAFIKQAAALLMDDLNNGRVIHYDQGPLNRAVEVAVKRKVGMFGWAFGRSLAEDDITALEAASLALRLFDEMPKKREFMSMVA